MRSDSNGTRLRPSLCLDRVPSLERAPFLATALRESWGVGTSAPLDPEEICRNLEIDLVERSLGASAGGAQGFLIPHHGGRFRIEVDPEPPCGWSRVAASAATPLRRHRMRFLTCHELAHTVFYDRSGNGAPTRLVGDSPEQETFCDELARALLVPRGAASELPSDTESVIALQRRYDVSMELALRSVVAAHHGAVAWLLLQRDDGIRIQWTSAARAHTASALGTLKQLARRAARAISVEVKGEDAGGRFEARFLAPRRQVIVTSSSLGRPLPPALSRA